MLYSLFNVLLMQTFRLKTNKQKYSLGLFYADYLACDVRMSLKMTAVLLQLSANVDNYQTSMVLVQTEIFRLCSTDDVCVLGSLMVQRSQYLLSLKMSKFPPPPAQSAPTRTWSDEDDMKADVSKHLKIP